MNEEIMVTIIATGFPEVGKTAPQVINRVAASQPAPQQPLQSPLGFGVPTAPQQAEPISQQQTTTWGTQQPQQTGERVNSGRISVEDDFPEFLRRIKK
jgi:hypothetical protein